MLNNTNQSFLNASWGSLFHLYTDGSCLGNPGPGGWAFLVYQEGQPVIHQMSGNSPDSTNNRMEIQAVLEGLLALREAHQQSGSSDTMKVRILTDSKYVLDTFEKGWIDNWMRNGWRNSQKKPVKNKDLWEKLRPLVVELKPAWQWVKGHSGDTYNEQVDQLAVRAASAV